MATLEQEMKNVQSELQEHRVNAVEGNHRTPDPNQKGRQTATRLCNYCRTYPKMVTQEDKRRRAETNQEQENCGEKGHVYSRLQQ